MDQGIVKKETMAMAYDDNNIFEEHPKSQELQHLKNYATQLFYQFTGIDKNSLNLKSRAWICGTGSKYFMKSHNHANSIVSSLFYFQVHKGGDLIFQDPRSNASRGYPSELKHIMNFSDITISPKAGDILFFPSFLYHSVQPTHDNSLRVAVAIDFFCET